MKNRIINVIITITLFFGQGFCVQNYLQFSQTYQKRELIYEVTSYGSVTVDAYGSNQILVRNSGGQPDWKKIASINFHCKIEKLSNDSEIDSAHLCYKSSIESSEICHDVRHIKSLDLNSKLTILIDTDLSRGFTANFMIKNNMASIEGFYYCKLTNRVNSLTSNYIEVQDLDYDMKKYIDLFKPIQKSQEISVDRHSRSSLTCGTAPLGYRTYDSFFGGKLQESPFSWRFCPNKACDEKMFSDLSPLNNMFEFVQHQNGTLDILKFKTDSLFVNLICLEKLYPKEVYSNYFLEVTDTNPIVPYNENILPISDKKTKIVLREGKSTKISNILSAVYYSNHHPTMTTATWMKDGTPVNKLFSNLEWTNYNLIFPEFIKPAFSGQYTLVIEQMQPKDKYEFLFDVQVINVPSFEIEPTPVIFKIIGQSLSLKAEVSGNVKNMAIEIDNKSVNINEQDFSNKNSSLSTVFVPKNVNGRAEISLSAPSITRNTTYLSGNQLSHIPNKQETSSRTHTIAFIASNEYVVSRATTVLKVLDFPEIVPSQPQCNCKQPETLKRQYLRNGDLYRGEGLTLEHYWAINGEDARTSSHGIFLIVRNETAVLRNTTNIADLELTYRVQIFRPRHRLNDKVLLFDSADHPELVAAFNTKCVCVVKAGFPIVIVAIVIALVVVVLVVLLLVLCLTRSKGETYNIDKNERAIGNDPEAECRENERFLNYERQNDVGTVRGSRVSIGEGDSIGVTSDDGELDDGIDTTSYSEEGSFIGKYAPVVPPPRQPQSGSQHSIV